MVYSVDIRWRVVYFWYGKLKTISCIEKNLKISKSTVRCIIARYDTFGEVCHEKIGRPDVSQLMTRTQLLVLMEYVLEHESAYLREICYHIEEITGSVYNIKSVWNILRRYKYTRKKVSKFRFLWL